MWINDVSDLSNKRYINISKHTVLCTLWNTKTQSIYYTVHTSCEALSAGYPDIDNVRQENIPCSTITETDRGLSASILVAFFPAFFLMRSMIGWKHVTWCSKFFSPKVLQIISLGRKIKIQKDCFIFVGMIQLLVGGFVKRVFKKQWPIVK